MILLNAALSTGVLTSPLAEQLGNLLLLIEKLLARLHVLFKFEI